MPREAQLFESTNGSILKAYLLLKENSGSNITPNWYKRSALSRKKMHNDIATILKKNKLTGFYALKEFETKYQKECFYKGLRILLELERQGESRL